MFESWDNLDLEWLNYVFENIYLLNAHPGPVTLSEIL